MKAIYFFGLGITVLLLSACGPSKKEKAVGPGPVTESDKTRYNINPNDEVRYGIPDTVDRDSVKKR
ncbi:MULTISPECIES: hypothetical protein [Sphingobacterium]|uniref:hypothetical protein n=1 Tax=Sphingobacterium TaxID=28453 RepID=UPI0013DD2EF2|nr:MULTISPECIES: hypothetical protein [unclassified Sphingobacterium]